jgi:hypothetical protein
MPPIAPAPTTQTFIVNLTVYGDKKPPHSTPEICAESTQLVKSIALISNLEQFSRHSAATLVRIDCDRIALEPVSISIDPVVDSAASQLRF